MIGTNAVRYASATVLLAAVFYLGFLVGGWSAGPPASGAPDLQITRSALLEALDPTPDQRVLLEAVMERTRLEADSVMRDLLGGIRALTTEAEVQMREHLTPEQNAILDTLVVGSGDRGPPRRERSRD